MAYRECPSLFANYESARSITKGLRNGSTSHVKNRDVSPSPFSGAGDPFSELVEGDPRVTGEPWAPFILRIPAKALVLTDVHIPYHNKAALLTAINEGHRQGVNTILLGGDLADCHSLSMWTKDPRDRVFPSELEMVIDFLEMLRERFPKANIIYKLGNHEERWITYMRLKAKELLGLAQFDFESVYELKRLRIGMVDDKRPVQMGGLSFLHGHEYPFAISNPVNPARGLFLRCKAYAMCGHFHQPSHHTENTVKESSIATWSTGCLCDLHPEYRPLNNWQHGFAIVEVDKAGQFNVQNRVIKGGRIY